MKKGILVFDHWLEAWWIWIGQKSYEVEPGDHFDLWIGSRYYPVTMERHEDWCVTGEEFSFQLRHFEIYKVRKNFKFVKEVFEPPF